MYVFIIFLQKIVSGSDSENRYNKLMERVGSSISFDINLSKILTYCLLFMSEFHDDIEGMQLHSGVKSEK